MSLIQKMTEDLKVAMKSGDHARVEAIRFILAGLKGAEKDKFAKDPNASLTDEEAAAVLQKEMKRRRESIELFKKGGRSDLVEKEEADLRILAEYAPRELSPEEIEKVVDGLLAKGFSDFNMLMREAMKELKGRADGKVVGDIVKKRIG